MDAVALGTNGLVVFCPVRNEVRVQECFGEADWDQRITPAWLLCKSHFTQTPGVATESPNTYEALPLTRSSATAEAVGYFRTRSGNLGLLQITGATNNPPGLKIRYKLVQEQQPSRPKSATGASRPPTTKRAVVNALLAREQTPRSPANTRNGLAGSPG